MISIWKKALGITLIVIGVAGLFLPFIQGILLIVIGLGLVGNVGLIIWLRKKLGKKAEMFLGSKKQKVVTSK